MKRIFVFISLLALVLLTVPGLVSCGGTPPAAPAPSPQPAASPASDSQGPVLEVGFSPRYFSPDNDGVEDELTVTIGCRDESAIRDWKIEIREPEQQGTVFFTHSGQGNPPDRFLWDGRGANGELVQSASDYPFSLVVTDVHGNSSAFEGKIETDVLVVRDGNVLRVQVPSIVFGSYSGGFDGLNQTVLYNNDFILKRIAQVLNKFNSYKVRVEGHANYTAATESARRLEQERELLPLSEQRARYVLDYLVRLGVDRARLSAVGIGGARPVAAYAARADWWKNRRVEFILVK